MKPRIKPKKIRAHLLFVKGCSLKMLDTVTRSQIVELKESGCSIRKIANKLGISRQSVRKYSTTELVLDTETNTTKFSSYLKQNTENIKELFFTYEGHCIPMVIELETKFSGNINIRTLQCFCKQFRQELKSINSTTPFRYETQPGDHMQIDFGEKDVLINGEIVRVHFFVAVLGYSRRIYIKAFTAENTEAWLNGIESAFQHYNGIPIAVVSDNTKCLVTSHIGQTVTLNERYKAFCHYWNVKPIVCTPYRPRSKGKCERMVRYVKENALVGKEFKSIESLQEWLDIWLINYSDLRKLSEVFTESKTPIERFKKEIPELRPFTRVMFTSISEEIRKVDKCGLIRVDNYIYKLPEYYANKSVLLQISDNIIEVKGNHASSIKLDKVTDIYSPKLQEKSIQQLTNQENNYSDLEIYDNNIIGRPTSSYEEFTGDWT